MMSFGGVLRERYLVRLQEDDAALASCAVELLLAEATAVVGVMHMLQGPEGMTHSLRVLRKCVFNTACIGGGTGSSSPEQIHR